MRLGPAGFIAVCALLSAACGGTPTTPTSLPWDPTTQARVVTQNGNQEQCIAPVRVYEIDGQTTSVSAQGFYLEAGVHTLKAQGFVNTTGCPLLTARGDFRVPPLERSFEAGVTYHLGLDHRSPRAAEWRLVVWKIDCAEGADCLGT